MTKAQAKTNTTFAAKDTAPDTILSRINTPADMKSLSDEQLQTLNDDVRTHMINSVAKTGGHLGAGLGVVELTTALHAVFDAPRDKFIWDVGHQAYPHKILTGRKDQMHTLRQGGGLSGFTKRDESEYDPFGAAHSSTSISAGLGMATARDIKLNHRHSDRPQGAEEFPLDTKERSLDDAQDDNDDNDNDFNVIAIIGDGAMSAGMAYEAMNNAGVQKNRMIVILNDNEMSIAPPVGAMSRYLTDITSSSPYRKAREMGKKITGHLPSPIRHAAKRLEEGARIAGSGGSLFEELGFYYIGPVDGHDLPSLLKVLRNIKDDPHDGPVMIHVMTQKGKGYQPAENAADFMHGVKPFDTLTGKSPKSTAPSAPSYTNVFADSLIREATADDRIVAITAAMPSGTGIDAFGKAFPDRSFDVGIAEQHAITFAAGLAAEGMKPFATIYSTFMQRAYDQIVHDVAIQNLPVRFCMDRAGLVGADGQTHAGAFDIAYMGCLPNMTLMAAADEAELSHMVATAASYDSGPLALRYPRGNGTGVTIPAPQILEIGKGRIVKEGTDIAILSYGTRLEECLKARELLEKSGISTTIADARFAKPLDETLIRDLIKNHAALITIEEGSSGGFGSFVLEFLAREGLLHSKIRNMHLPDLFQNHDDPYNQYETAGLNAAHIVKTATSLLK